MKNAAVTKASVLIEARAHAASMNLNPDRISLEGEDVAAKFIMRITGNDNSASRDIAAFFQGMKLGQGRWKPMNGIAADTRDSVKLFFTTDKNPFHMKLQNDGKLLAKAASALLPNRKVFSRESGIVEVDFAPLARVMPKPGDGSKLAKVSIYRSTAAKLGITKPALVKEYKALRADKYSLAADEWSDGESDEDEQDEDGKGE